MGNAHEDWIRDSKGRGLNVESQQREKKETESKKHGNQRERWEITMRRREESGQQKNRRYF